jgi:hypothetical protein
VAPTSKLIAASVTQRMHTIVLMPFSMMGTCGAIVTRCDLPGHMLAACMPDKQHCQLAPFISAPVFS